MAEAAFLLGIAGGALVLIGFILDEARVWGRKDISYNAVNAAGACSLAYYAWTISGYPFLLVNTVWFLVALWKCISIAKRGA